MLKTLTLARREMAAYFLSPIGYVIAAVFLAACGLFFFKGSIALLANGIYFFGFTLFEPPFAAGAPATLRPLLLTIAALMVFALPLLTMRLVAEEKRSGTIESLITAPVSDAQIILGKFLGVMVFYLVLLAGTLVHLGLMARFGSPDAGVAAMGYLGLVLLGASFASVGLFASTLTQHQLLAAVIATAILVTLSFLTMAVSALLPPAAASAVAAVNPLTYFDDFSKGILDLRGVVFFVSSTALFLFLATITLGSRRWR